MWFEYDVVRQCNVEVPQPCSPRVHGGDDRPRKGDYADICVELMPHFPIGGFFPHSKCPHKQTYERGSNLVCMVCHKSGQDHRRGVKRPRVLPPANRKPKPEPIPNQLTRAEKREMQRTYAGKELTADERAWLTAHGVEVSEASR